MQRPRGGSELGTFRAQPDVPRLTAARKKGGDAAREPTVKGRGASPAGAYVLWPLV